MSKEAMTLALEALTATMATHGFQKYIDQAKDDAITALREALADQPAQTATYTCGVCGVPMQMEKPAQPQQEPVAIALNTGTKQGVKWLKNIEHGEHLYTSPPAQRTWVGLTDEESTVIWANSQSVDEAIRATEKQLMENNI